MSETLSNIGGKVLALVILLVAGWILLKLVIGVVTFVAWTVVAVLAVIAGATNAGTNFAATNNPAVANADPVPSKTRTAKAISAKLSPNSFSAYETASRRNGETLNGNPPLTPGGEPTRTRAYRG